MHYNTKVAKAKELHEAARQLRGRFLNSVAVIDVKIGEFLASYFCNDEKRRALFMSEITTNQSFALRTKVNLLKKIVKSEFDFYLEEYPEIFNELEKIRKFRNELAHATIDVSDKALERGPEIGIGFVFYKNGKKHVKVISPKQAEDYHVRTNMLLSNLTNLLRLIGINTYRGLLE